MVAAGHPGLVGPEDFLPHLGGPVHMFLGPSKSALTVGLGDRRFSAGNAASEPETIKGVFDCPGSESTLKENS